MHAVCRPRLFRIAAQLRAASGSDGKESPLRRLLKDSSSFGEAGEGEGELQWATQPYTRAPQEPPPPRTDPRETAVLLFPGQGSQHVGMGKNLLHLPAAVELYELASSVVGWDVRRVCLEGPAEELEQRCQTCVLVTSLAAVERARDERPSVLERVRAVAGFSLGEITALVFAGAIPFEQALQLVEIRSAAMNAASAARAGGMLTLWLAAGAELGHALLRAREHAAQRGVPEPVAQVANYLYPHCRVVAGDEEALKFLEQSGASFGIRRSARVRVAGAFHTRLMRPAAVALAAALRAAELRPPALRVLSAVDARPYRDVAHIRRQLPKQVEAAVRWEQALQAMFARSEQQFPLTLALGPGAALRATLKQVNAKAWDSSLQIPV